MRKTELEIDQYYLANVITNGQHDTTVILLYGMGDRLVGHTVDGEPIYRSRFQVRNLKSGDRFGMKNARSIIRLATSAEILEARKVYQATRKADRKPVEVPPAEPTSTVVPPVPEPRIVIRGRPPGSKNRLKPPVVNVGNGELASRVG